MVPLGLVFSILAVKTHWFILARRDINIGLHLSDFSSLFLRLKLMVYRQTLLAFVLSSFALCIRADDRNVTDWEWFHICEGRISFRRLAPHVVDPGCQNQLNFVHCEWDARSPRLVFGMPPALPDVCGTYKFSNW
jgi:hypothetical protein